MKSPEQLETMIFEKSLEIIGKFSICLLHPNVWVSVVTCEC